MTEDKPKRPDPDILEAKRRKRCEDDDRFAGEPVPFERQVEIAKECLSLMESLDLDSIKALSPSPEIHLAFDKMRSGLEYRKYNGIHFYDSVPYWKVYTDPETGKVDRDSEVDYVFSQFDYLMGWGQWKNSIRVLKHFIERVEEGKVGNSDIEYNPYDLDRLEKGDL